MNNSVILEKKVDNYLFIDVLRGIAIFLMLWGHCIQYCCSGCFDFFENVVFKIIYSFHMPLFMLISGYLFFFSAKKRTLNELIKHRTQSMLHPIIMCGILYFLLCDVVLEALKGNYLAIFGGRWLGHLQDYWFLWSVLSASIIVGIAYKFSNNKFVSALILIFGILFVYMMPCAEMNVFTYPYFVIGFLFSSVANTSYIKKFSFLKYLSLIIFPVMMLFFRKEHYIYTSGFFGEEGLIAHTPVNMYRWAIGLIGSIFIITLLELFFNFMKDKIKKLKVICFFEDLGKHSLAIYTLSCVFLSRYLPIVHKQVIELFGSNIFAENMIIYNFIFTPLLAVLYSIGLLLLIRLLKKYHLHKLLFGK